MELLDPLVDDAWRRIEAWAAAHLPGMTGQLAGPAAAADIASLDRAFGRQLPADFKASLAIHDGESPGGSVFDSGEILLPVEYIGEFMQAEAGLARSYVGMRAESRSAAVHPELYRPGRLCVADFNRDVQLLLDFAPATAGTVGQVLRRDVENGILELVARSWSTFLADYASRLEQGRDRFDPEQRAELAVARQASPRDAVLERFFAELKAQGDWLDLEREADGAILDLLGFVGFSNAMAPGELPLQIYGKTVRLKGDLGVSKQEVLLANGSGDALAFRIRAKVRHDPSQAPRGRTWIELISFKPF